jgi:hypothetical protein
LEPTIDNERVFKTAHPDDKEPMIIEVKPGGESGMEIDVFSK